MEAATTKYFCMKIFQTRVGYIQYMYSCTMSHVFLWDEFAVYMYDGYACAMCGFVVHSLYSAIHPEIFALLNIFTCLIFVVVYSLRFGQPVKIHCWKILLQ